MFKIAKQNYANVNYLYSILYPYTRNAESSIFFDL